MLRRVVRQNAAVQPDQVMRSAARLGSSLEALAALAAYLRVETEQLAVDPRVHDLLRAVALEVLGEEPDLTRAQGAPVVGMTRALLAQSAELVADPGRAAGWTPDDDALLQGIGRMSAPIAGVIAGASGDLDGLANALQAPGAAVLDVGTGTGWLAIALAQAFPAASVVGIDIYERALALARQNVAAAGLADRIELRIEDASRLVAGDTYDAIWLPMPFLPRDTVPSIMAAAVAALRPGGWLLPGTFAGPPDALSRLLVDLRTVRAGGHPWDGADLVDEMTRHGVDDAHEVERTWTAPVRLYAGRRSQPG
jgi:2-polyprenyl-3-methyl-5-hydroxy-6-metoxy-1,4-benzoquinol methylase